MKKKVTTYLNIYENGVILTHPTEESAKSASSPACKHVAVKGFIMYDEPEDMEGK